MKTRLACLLTLILLLMATPALADKSPGCLALGSQKAAEHLYAAHVYAYTDAWDGVLPSACADEGCEEYGHVHCYGIRVTLWDTPAKGKSRVAYYPFGTDGKVGPDTEFQLVDVVTYKNKYYANIRIYEDGYAVNSGSINADYVGCDCESYEGFEALPEYIHDHPAFSLR